MAGFSIDIGDEGVAYERAVKMPSSSTSAAAVAGTVKIADGIFKVLDQYDKATKASGPTDSSIKRAAYGKLAQAVNATKGQSPLNVRTAVTSAIVEYTNAGFEIGQAEKDLVTSATGINIDYLGFDPNQAAIDSALESINNNRAYLFGARDKLDATGKPYTQTELLQTAIQEVQKVESAALYIANSQVTDEADFQRNYMPQG